MFWVFSTRRTRTWRTVLLITSFCVVFVMIFGRHILIIRIHVIYVSVSLCDQLASVDWTMDVWPTVWRTSVRTGGKVSVLENVSLPVRDGRLFSGRRRGADQAAPSARYFWILTQNPWYAPSMCVSGQPLAYHRSRFRLTSFAVVF